MARTVAELEVVADADTSRAEQKLDSLGGKVSRSASDAKTASLAFIGMGTAIAGGLGMAIGTAANFESAISGIGAVAGLTGGELDKVRAKAIELGSKTAFSATEAANAMETLLKAGMPLETVLNGGTQAALDLAAAAGTDVVTAAELMTSALNVFGSEAGTATDVANSFNAAANASAASIESLALGFSMAALPAKMMGLSLNDLNVALALFSQNGLQGSDAATSFKTMLLSMANPTAEQKRLMDELGISFFDARGNFIGLEGAADQLRAGLSGMTEEQRNATLATLFGSDAVRAASILYNEGSEGISKMRTEMANQATAADQAKARMDNLKGALETLKGTVETAAILIGGQLTPYLQSLAEKAQGAVQWFNALSPAMQGNIAKGAALAAGLLVLVGALGMASTALGPLAAGFSLLTGPIGLVAAAIAGLYIAYQTNFLGFRDGVNAGIEFLKGKWPALQSAVETAASAIAGAWDELTSHWGTVRSALEAGWSGLQTAWSAVQSGISAGVTVITAAWVGLQSALSTGASIVSMVWSGLQTTWSAVQTGLGTGMSAVRTAWAALQVALGIGAAMLSVVWSGLQTAWSAVQSGLSAGFEALRLTFEEMRSGIATAVGGIKTIFTGLQAFVTGVTGAIKAIVTGDFEGAKKAATTMKDQVTSAVSDLKTGVFNRLNELLGTGTAIMQGLRTAVVNTVTGMKDSALQRISELKQGIRDRLAAIPGEAAAAVGDLSGVLFGAGASLISGLISGIESKLGDLKGKLGEVTNLIPDIKGPPVKDARLLTPNGRLIMRGLIAGLDDEVPALKRMLGSLTAEMPAMVQSTGAVQAAPVVVSAPAPVVIDRGGRSIVVYQTYHVTLRLDDLEELTEAAEFVRSLPRERELVLGGSF